MTPKESDMIAQSTNIGFRPIPRRNFSSRKEFPAVPGAESRVPVRRGAGTTP